MAFWGVVVVAVVVVSAVVVGLLGEVSDGMAVFLEESPKELREWLDGYIL